MPLLKQGESKESFISRCVPVVMNEGNTQEQALGKCYGIFRNQKKKSLIEISKQIIDSFKKNK